MQRNIIEEYLVKIGWETDKKSLESTQKALADVRKGILAIGAGFAAATGAIVAFSAGISTAGRKLGNITTGVDKFALSLYTTTQNARSLQTVMKAMDIDSLEDLKYINLMPEQRKQFMELRALAQELAPDAETQKGLAELRKLGFEFQKMQIQLASVGLKLLGAIGNLMATPLFKKIPIMFELTIALLAFIAEMIKEKLGKHPVESAAGGIAGALAGAAGGAFLGARLGAPLGPWGIAGGALTGGAIGAAGGLPAGIKIGGDIAENKTLKTGIKKVQKETKAVKQEINKRGQHLLKSGVKTSQAINTFLSEMDSLYGEIYTVTSGVDGRSGASWHPKGLAADMVPKDTSAEGYAKFVKSALSSENARKINLEVSKAKYMAVKRILDAQGVNYGNRLTRQITGDWTGEHMHVTLKPINVSIQIDGARDPQATANAVVNRIQTALNTNVLQGRMV